MQQLRSATASPLSPDGCARALLAGVPSVMRFLRSQMRGHRQAQLSVPHFRALVFVRHHADASLSALAEHVGLSLPAASRMVETLVRRDLLQRRARHSDRRSVSLSLTRRGKAVLRAALQATQAALAERFDTLSTLELTLVSQAMGILSRVFPPEDGGTGKAQ